MAIEKLKSHKSPGIDHIPVELIKTGGGTCSEIHQFAVRFIKLFLIRNKEELPEGWKELIIVPIYTVAHERPARRLVDQRGRRSRTLYRKLNK